MTEARCQGATRPGAGPALQAGGANNDSTGLGVWSDRAHRRRRHYSLPPSRHPLAGICTAQRVSHLTPSLLDLAAEPDGLA
jgi:hypothetical protein